MRVPKGPSAMIAYLGVGLAAALAAAMWWDPVVAAGLGAVAVALAVYAAWDDGSRGAVPYADELGGEAAAFLPVVAGTRFGGVFVEVGPSELVLCLFPVADADAARELDGVKAPPDMTTAALIVFNDAPGEHLFGERVADVLGVDRGHVYATAPERKLTRSDGNEAGTRQAKRLPQRLACGDTTLERDGACLRVRWGARYDGASALFGAAIPTPALRRRPAPTFLVGGLAFDGSSDLEGVGDALLSLKHVMLIDGRAHGGAERDAQLFGLLGIGATVLGGIDRPKALADALAATREGGATFDAHEAPVPVWIEVFTELAVLGEHALAEERLEALLARRPDPRLRFELGMSRLMRGELEAAREAFRAAAEGGSEIAWNSLASVLGELGRVDEAIEAVEEGCRRMPRDPITHRTAFALHARAGDRERAEAVLASEAFDDEERERLRPSLDDERPSITVQRFTGYAEIALARGTTKIDDGDLEGAATLLRRAVALDPQHLEATVELAFALGKLDADDELRALCERAIERVPGGELLRFNLGNLAIRRERWDEAREHFETLLARLPEHRDARVNLVSALCALDRKDEARAHLGPLESAGVDPEVITQLRAQCA